MHKFMKLLFEARTPRPSTGHNVDYRDYEVVCGWSSCLLCLSSWPVNAGRAAEEVEEAINKDKRRG